MPLPELLDELLTSLETGSLITAVRHFEARPAVFAPFPSSLDPRLVESLRSRGVQQLYSHQARAFEVVSKGENLVVVTPTASGKTLCYNLPVLQALVQQPESRVLYLFPTKALAQDQLAELMELAKTLPDMRMYTYDGDTPQDARRSVRARANLVLTNPDMLHSGILPHHTKWVNLFQNLRYVVIDELHAYRGVFGSHLANVLRRLKRICRHYGVSPQFIMASATIANPRELAERPTGEPVGEVSESGGPTGEKLFLCYNPPVVNAELGIRAPYLGEAAGLAIRFLKERVATIVFCQSRLATEVVLSSVKKGVEDKTGDAGMVRGYRGGYLPLRRREVEQGLRAGDVLGVVATSALELGIDIGHLDVAVLAGYPGTIASMWQQAGRAGRRSELSAAILVATSSPMDQYLASHPDYLFGASPEHARINPENPFILVNHLKCATFELPFGRQEVFGGDVQAHLQALEEEGLLHRAGEQFHWTSETYPADHVSLRTVTSDNFLVIDTTARDEKQVGFKKIKISTMENVGSGEVELPQQEMQTTAAWLTIDPALLAEISSHRDELVDGLRALTRLLHSLAPIFLLCDIRDIGAWLGDGTPSAEGQVVTRETMRAQLVQGDEFTPTIYLYDNQPGGIGLAERIFEVLSELLARGLETLESCACPAGCPSCVEPVNEVGRRAKPVALELLKRLVPRG